MRRLETATLGLLVLAACDPAQRPGGDGGGSPIDASPGADATPALEGAVDVLFVIDNSGTMREEQAALVSYLGSFLARFEIAFGRRPSMHIGVVSSDVGAGADVIERCEGVGDNGVLQSIPRVENCTPPDGNFIKDTLTPDGQRQRNYPVGELRETFSCVATLGTDGCGFEQTLEAMRRALDGRNPENEGFRRPGAALAVIFVTDEDDCSAADNELFNTDPEQNRLMSELGPLGSYRCFEFGVVCEPDERETVGPRENCQPRNPSPYLYSVDSYANFLRTIAPEERIAIGVVSGPPTPVNVSLDSNNNDFPQLDESCTGANGSAVPAIRLHALAGSFSSSVTGEICDDFEGSLETIAQTITDVIP